MATKIRLTEQAIADVKAATTAKLIKSPGGYRVEVCNDNDCVRLIDRVGHPVLYTSKENAKRALNRHNENDIEISIKSRLDK